MTTLVDFVLLEAFFISQRERARWQPISATQNSILASKAKKVLKNKKIKS